MTTIIECSYNKPDMASIINEHSYDKVSKKAFMRMFNSDVPLSNEYIVESIDNIVWSILTRPLPECIIERFQRKIVRWNDQLYGRSRTIEFLVQYQNKFDWNEVSMNPPEWFDEFHADIFGDRLNWYALTPRAINYSMNILSYHVDDLDWQWITKNNIPDEPFARRFVNHIIWDMDEINTDNISTEFIYELNCARKVEYDIAHKKIVSPRMNSFSMIIIPSIANNYVHRDKLVIGGSITLMFFRKHMDEIDINELKKRNLFTPDMQVAIDNND